MSQGEVIGIFIGSKPGERLHSVESVKAVPAKGLEGDRYFGKRGTYLKRPGVMDSQEATLIESESIEALRRELGLDFAVGESRRNIVTRGVALNHLVGKEFTIGDVRFKGIRLCEPCGHLEQITYPGVLKTLVHRGGLRAQILTEGVVRVGDSVKPAVLESSAACAS